MIRWLISPDLPESAVASLNHIPLDAPFSEERIAFIHTLSQTILTDPQARAYPELMAMAYWFRKAHLNQLHQQFQADYQKDRQARGTIFHIAPGNVDTLFMYSWLLSLLLGNHNLVRVSQQLGEQMQKLLAYIQTAMKPFSGLTASNFIFTYPHDDAMNMQLSRSCDLRVTWGGDKTVDHIQSLPLPPNARDIGFRDRFSLAVFNAPSITELNEQTFREFLAAFYNDALWFDQRACASPKLIVWIGEDEIIQKARRQFWPAFSSYIASKNMPSCAQETIARATILMNWGAQALLTDETASLDLFPAHCLLKNMNDMVRLTHPGLGLFAELGFHIPEALFSLLSEKDQTISIFGFSKITEENFRQHLNRHHPASRLVATGSALNFSTRWDGVDFLETFTKAATR